MYHPEEYPQEFQQLRDAYKQAMKYAKGKKKPTISGMKQSSRRTFEKNLRKMRKIII